MSSSCAGPALPSCPQTPSSQSSYMVGHEKKSESAVPTPKKSEKMEGIFSRHTAGAATQNTTWKGSSSDPSIPAPRFGFSWWGFFGGAKAGAPLTVTTNVSLEACIYIYIYYIYLHIYGQFFFIIV